MITTSNARVALVCGETLRPAMAGIGVRYLEMAQRLARPGLEVVLLTRGGADQVPHRDEGRVEVRELSSGLSRALRGCDVVVAQGDIADSVLEVATVPVVIDLYDPWLIENLSYVAELGTEPYLRDYASWHRQLARGDFFVCSSEAQRLFYLGWLAALGRVNGQHYRDDPDMRDLIDVVPCGVAGEQPVYRPLLPERAAHERRILFGGIYDWLDPWVVLEAMSHLDRPDWKLVLVANPNRATTPQRERDAVERWCRERGWWGERVVEIDWVPAERRWDLFRDVDTVVVSHRDSLETRLSLRTRGLDALAAGRHVIATRGGGLAELLERHGLGTLVDPGDVAAMARSIATALDRETPATALSVPETLSWEAALAPLVRFCLSPRKAVREAAPATSTRSVASAARGVLRLLQGRRR